MTDLDVIEQFLAHRTGIVPDSLGPRCIEIAVRRRMVVCNLDSAKAYATRLSLDQAETNALIDEIVVPESWFFRDEKPFEQLQRFVHQRIPTPTTSKPFRALSAPCAGGEEPYSIAMTLLDAGLESSAFHIDGIDISHRLVLEAGSKPYSSLSFRTSNLDFRKKYFSALPSHLYQLKPRLGACVQFRQANLTDPNFLVNETPYDAIFCRNVLIYLDDPSRLTVFRHLDRLLADDGILFVGHVEATPAINNHFRALPFPGAFAFQKKTKPVRSRTPMPKPSSIRGHSSETGRQNRIGDLRPSPVATAPRPRAKDAPPTPSLGSDGNEADLDRIEDQANTGRLSEAEALCRTYLKSHQPNARAFFLLGMIQIARHAFQDAEATLGKAIYLEPTHSEALLHLSLLADRRGNKTQASRLQQRLRRLQRTPETKR